MAAFRPYALGAAVIILADGVFDVQLLAWPAVAVILICLTKVGMDYGRRRLHT